MARGVVVPQLRDDGWDLADACRSIEEATSIPARRWCDPATALVDGLDADRVWRHPPPILGGADGGTLDLA